ncbi:hypothetical protein MPSEU_000541500 [Mayamaea pseudoterrestris]|nr:hypothetical protein MPSEU_000541500 [Mayamaea pseudoterrestris]
MEAATRGRNRKRPSPWQEQTADSGKSCSYCEKEKAAILVSIPSDRNKPSRQQRLCLLHYYTTSAVHSKPEDVTIMNDSELEKQLPTMQSLFADVFVEVKQELSEEAARSFQATAHDPLAIIGKLHKAPSTSTKRLQRPPSVHASDAGTKGGGFIESIPLPERLLRTQHLQQQKQAALQRRMEHAAKNDTRKMMSSTSHTQRRKPTRKSIWNVMEDAAHKPTSAITRDEADGDGETLSFLETTVNVVCGSCGSNDVVCLSSGTARNEESRKGEIWGSGSRDEVVMRYQCQKCGKTWNEEE